MKKLIVVDSGNVMHRAIFSYSAQYKKAKQEIVDDIDCSEEEAIQILNDKIKNWEIYIAKPTLTYVKMIIGYLKRIEVTLDDIVVIAEDFGSWRKEIDKKYKAQRKDYRESREDADWWKQIYGEFNELMPKLADCLPFYFIKLYKMEADDIASVAIRYINADEKIMISSDEDWQMLCSIPNTRVFSPHSKKFKEVKNPEKILLKKIKGDVSDNLLEVPKTEKEWEKRKMIVDLLHLPLHIENPIKEMIMNLPHKKLNLNKIPYKSCRKEIVKLYHLED